MPFYGSIELRGLNGKTTTKRWKLNQTGSDGPAFVAAKAKIEAIASALQAITNAVTQDVGVSFVTETYAAGAGDLTEQALVNVWAEDTSTATDVLAISQVYVPAPVVGIFMDTSGSGYDIVDRTDAGLQTFIDALSAGAFISDNETIDTGTAVNGIENGRRVTRKSS